jgi:hypothetical protein
MKRLRKIATKDCWLENCSSSEKGRLENDRLWRFFVRRMVSIGDWSFGNWLPSEIDLGRLRRLVIQRLGVRRLVVRRIVVVPRNYSFQRNSFRFVFVSFGKKSKNTNMIKSCCLV